MNLMHLLATALVLGLVEGVTEFLPVSSTGHLILFGEMLRFGDARAGTFIVFIQLGAIMAIIVLYRSRLASLLRFRSEEQGFAGKRGLGLLALTTLPAAVVGVLFHGMIKEYLFQPAYVAYGLAIGSVWILLIELFVKRHRKEGLDALTWRDALSIGIYQTLALWPGMSRSASTILGGMMSGVERKTATEYSFLAAIPVMTTACLYDLFKGFPSLTMADIPLFGAGFVVSFAFAWVAVRLLIQFVSKHTLAPFAWYRLAVAGVVFWLLAR